MFGSGCSEADSKEIIISSCSFDCLEVIIYYMYYSDFQPEFVPKASFELWYEIATISHEWGITGLAKLACVFLSLNVNPENHRDILNLSMDLGSNYDGIFKYIM